MAVDGMNTASRQLEFDISRYFDVQHLSAQVRQKWQQAAVENREYTVSSLEDISRRQQAAEENRVKQQALLRMRTKALKRSFQSQEEVRRKRAQKLEEKLAIAECKRQSGLEERKLRASQMLQRTLEVAERVSERQNERAARLGAKLTQAGRARETQIAAAAAKGSGAAAHAKAVSAATRAREEAEAMRRKTELELRLQRAGDARHELTQTVLASLAPRGAEPFLVRRAVTRSILRRQSSSRMLQRSWRSFSMTQRTTAALARAVVSTGITNIKALGSGPPTPPWSSRQASSQSTDSPDEPATPANTPADTTPDMSPGGSPKRRRPQAAAAPPVALVGVRTTLLNSTITQQVEDPFEIFAKTLQAPATLKAAGALLRRCAVKLKPADKAAGTEALLKKLFPRARNPDRYPVRVFLCAYMILKHPQVVFNQRGDREQALSSAAGDMVTAFEVLLLRLLDHSSSYSRSSSGVLSSSNPDSVSMSSAAESGRHLQSTSAVAELLAGFDQVWLQYLEQFVAWKLADAASLEAELVRVAVEMETSKLAKLSSSGSASPRQPSPEDREALVEQVRRDHALLSERIERLGGKSGLARLEAGLAAARAKSAASESSPPSPAQSARSSPARGGPSTPVRPSSATAAKAPSTPEKAVTNETLAWELLYDLNFQLPTAEAEASWKDATAETDVMREPLPPTDLSPSAAAAATSLRVRRIAERAFWDSLAGSGAEQVAGLLNELAMQLVEALPPKSRIAAHAKQHFIKDRLQEAISAGSTEDLLPAFQQLATILHEVGAPARQLPAAATHARIQTELKECSGNASAVSRVLVKALRLMSAQLRLLQIDMSNATMRMLANSLAAGEGIRYAQEKFAAKHEISKDMPSAELALKLPHTRAWLAQASGQMAGIQSVSPLLAPSANAQTNGAPAFMRTGRMASTSNNDTANEQTIKRPAATLVCSTEKEDAWRGLVRIGLTAFLTAEEPLNVPPPPLPETFGLDAGRIHEAKEAFQHLAVLSACLMVVQQTAATKGVPPPDANSFKLRLKALLGDQNLGLVDLTTEICAALPGVVLLEEHISQALKRMLARGSPAFKALTLGHAKIQALQSLHVVFHDWVSAAAAVALRDMYVAVLSSLLDLDKVLQQLLLGNDLPNNALQSALARYGAGDLVIEAKEVAEKLGAIAAVSEAVHQRLYIKLAEGLL